MHDETTEEMLDREERDRHELRPLVSAGDLDGLAAAIFAKHKHTSDLWVDDNWSKMVQGCQLEGVKACSRGRLMGAVGKLMERAQWAEMEGHKDVTVLRAIARSLSISFVSPREVSDRISFKVTTRKGRQHVRLDGYYTTAFYEGDDTSEAIRVLRELGAREVKRERRPGRPTGCDGWAW